jgi:uncharacterized protein
VSPRNNPVVTGMVACAALLWAVFPAWSKDTGTGAGEKNRFIQFYQDHLSGADGSRCPMVPSCSAYAAQAINKHGPILGWVMACDRILRCGRSEMTRAPRVVIQGHSYAHDPVSGNDFWWFDPRPEPGEPGETGR